MCEMPIDSKKQDKTISEIESLLMVLHFMLFVFAKHRYQFENYPNSPKFVQGQGKIL